MKVNRAAHMICWCPDAIRTRKLPPDHLPYPTTLERFPAKWIPVRVKKTRQNKEIEPPFRFNRNGKGSSSEDTMVFALTVDDGERDIILGEVMNSVSPSSLCHAPIPCIAANHGRRRVDFPFSYGGEESPRP
jgi:hypothetical protein